MLKALRQFNAKDVEVDRLYQNIAKFASQFTNRPILDGVVIKDITLISGDTTVNHGLGRTIQGWIVIDKSAAGDIYAAPAKQTSTTKTLILTSSAPLTASLYVF
jgi:hypothetical protein